MDFERPPTELERNCFYHGLPSQPKLVARSSLTPFRYNVDDPWSSDRKTLAVAGEHAIASTWNNEPSTLKHQILGILTQQNVDWQAIDILRIGYEDEEKPLIVSISVLTDTLPWKTGNQVARDCRKALVEHGLDDVHCEIKESKLVNLSSSFAVHQQDAHNYPPTYQSYMYQLSDQLGTAIASKDQPRREGTKGIYLHRIGSEPAEIFALTCRHVCYSSSEKGNRLPEENTLPSKPVIQSPEKTHNKTVHQLEIFRDKAVAAIHHAEQKQEACNVDLSSSIARLQGETNAANDMLQYFYRRTSLSSRIIGEVAYTSDYVVRTSKCLSDWCLIRLKADSHERRLSDVSNRVYIGGGDLKSRFPGREPTIIIQDLQDDQTIRIQGIVTVSELQDPRQERIVGTRGQRSGLTFGIVNNVKSVTRRVFDRELVSQECCIVADGDNASRAFTQPGNSGACVFDLAGRAVGMVTSGISRDNMLVGGDDYGLDVAVDVTYATPMEWLLADMKACGVPMEIL
ncbi:hypothetical protein CH063_00192 [Colletotrichum higginsianum]|uniref:Uncharacterized protein n=1 Tax=Colletotrichum higginsianum (strain IMI 349063) TaxID=759273 RepID=H1V412_COLHI|nr:hypothetical protein CH63R_14459 [Colletotrichum higginsianum IMI 349063]OBR02158.1 hypothetical protein CH63R_14459 [Colletotrichum higginsianum IMI 349063]CCF34964.1 hypothetical protein CH063_00192 [Colletotrichum higginsianum]